MKLIVFDADDTLWDCQSHFEVVTDKCCELLADYADATTVRDSLFQTERANMADLGFGTKAFTLSLVENAIKVSEGKVSAHTLLQIQMLGRELLHLPATPLPGVEETLRVLADDGRYRMVLFTKGELLDQQAKVRRSGLEHFFERVFIVSDKTQQAYRQLCNDCRVTPQEMMMVGNSFKSDIVPALAVGASAVYIPFHVTWALERAETFDHERLWQISRFDELLKILL